MSIRWIAAWLALTFAAAPIFAQQGQTPTADEKELASYRLNMETLKKVITANQMMAEKMAQDPKVQAQMKLQQELEALEQKEEPTEADSQRMEALQQKLAALEEEEEALFPKSAENLNDMETQIQKFPPLADALKNVGLAPREYAKFLLSSFQAGMVHSLKEQGLLKEIPPDVPPENITFMKAHQAEFNKLQSSTVQTPD